ncbi:hypothetical protein ARSEF4850_007414 [Beauveria asiatica]
MSSNTEPVGETGQRDSALPFVQYPSNLSHIFDSLRNLLKARRTEQQRFHGSRLLQVFPEDQQAEQTNGAYDQINAAATDSGGHEYHSLQAAYSAVCFLEKRVDYDSIRCRIALVELHREFERACTNRQEIEERRRIGWGVCSSTIDHILQSTHSDWSLLSTSQQKSCRAQFHDRKRYGKRWAVLTDGLGTGIVLLSSTHLAKAVHNTSITSGMLNHFVQHTRGDATTMRILEQVREVADQLWLGQPCGSHNANALLNTVKMGSGGEFQLLE